MPDLDLFSRFQAGMERFQAVVYLITIVIAVVLALSVNGTTVLESAINPALAIMLFATFLQIPLAELGRVFVCIPYPAALLIVNFIVIPCLISVLLQFIPLDPTLKFSVLLIFLTSRIDYMVTFAQIWKENSRLLLS